MKSFPRPEWGVALIVGIAVILAWVLTTFVGNGLFREMIPVWAIVLELILGALLAGLVFGLVRPTTEWTSAAVGGAMAGLVMMLFVMGLGLSADDIDRARFLATTFVSNLPGVAIGFGMTAAGQLLGRCLRRRTDRAA